MGVLSLLIPLGLAARVVINEVYYDHPGRDDGWEFIELYNKGKVKFDLSGLWLEFVDGRTGKARIVWSSTEGLVLGPGVYLVVAGSNRHPPPECILSGSLENGPDAVRLVSVGLVHDLVGYGALESAELYETEPAPDVEAGSSLSRKPDGRDTDSNSADFVCSSPSPGVKNFFRCDLVISIAGRRILPCRGHPFSLTLMIGNSGIEPFSGQVCADVCIAVCDEPVALERVDGTFDLDAAGIDSIIVTLSPPPVQRMEVSAVLRCAFDENHMNDTAVVAVSTSPGPIVVSEIMYRPLVQGSEWIELFNTGFERCNLRCWTIRDASSSPRMISEDDLLIDPGEYLILAQYPDVFVRDEPELVSVVYGVQGGWPVLNDRNNGSLAETVKICDESGILVEAVSYSDMLGNERGRSVERFSCSVCSSVPGGIWHRCASPEGSTPGSENSVGTAAVGVVGIAVSPNPFSPGYDRSVDISSSLLEGETGFLVTVFDLEGLKVRQLFGEEGGARVFSCRWDGRNSEGSFVSMGLYICLVEFVGLGGGVCRREKCCIAVAGVNGAY